MINESKYSDKNLLQRLNYFFTKTQFRHAFRFAFLAINVTLIILISIVASSVLFETIGFPLLYPFNFVFGKSIDEFQLPSGIKIPSGYQLVFKPKKDGDYININAESWQGAYLAIEYMDFPCEGEHKEDFKSEYIIGKKSFTVVNLGAVFSHYKYNNSDVFIRRAGSGILPDGFYFQYLAHVPEKCLSVMLYDRYVSMQEFLEIVEEIVFFDIEGEFEFIQIVNEQ